MRIVFFMFLFFPLFSFSSDFLHTKKIFENENFPLQDLIYLEVINKSNFKEKYNNDDLIDSVEACEYHNNFISDAHKTDDNYLKNLICKNLKLLKEENIFEVDINE